MNICLESWYRSVAMEYDQFSIKERHMDRQTLEEVGMKNVADKDSDNGFHMLENFSSDRNCFACGPDNPYGLRMEFESNGRQVVSRLTIPAYLCGWNSVVHGGVVATICDEIMSWTAIHLLRRIILTRSMEIAFHRPLLVERPVRSVGEVLEKESDRSAVISAKIYDEDANLCAEARGRFALFTPAAMRRMKILDENIVRDFERYFRTRR